MSTGPFFGKYRGTVHDNVDPYRLGRIRAIVAAVSYVFTGTGSS